MLQIRLNKGSAIDGAINAKPLPTETVTVACPDHIVLADLPVAKGLGSATASSFVKIVGRRSRRQLGERVHFCVRCDFPIAIYGRLSPCEHAFCLDCARSDSICYFQFCAHVQVLGNRRSTYSVCYVHRCDERIQKIQTIKIMEGIFLCAAPHCLKSFLKKTEFESHIHDNHADLLQPNMNKEEMNETETSGTKQQSSTLDTTLWGPPPRPGFPPSSNNQLSDREDKPRCQQSQESQPDNRPVGFDGSIQTRMQLQDLGQFPISVNSNPMLLAPPYYGAPVPYEVAQSYSTGEGGGVGFHEGYPRPWSGGAMPPPLPRGPPPPQLLQNNHGYYYLGDVINDGKNYGWQSDRRDGFGSSQD